MEKKCTNTFQTMEFVGLTELPFLDSFMIPGLVDNVKEAAIIYFLSENGMAMEQKYLFHLLHASRPSISTITNELIHKGLIEQIRNDDDHRGKYIHLTKLGTKVGKWMLFRRCHINQIQLRGFTIEEINLLNEMEKRMAMNLIDISDRDIRRLPSFENFNEKDVSKIPTEISHFDKLQYVSLSSRVKKQN